MLFITHVRYQNWGKSPKPQPIPCSLLRELQYPEKSRAIKYTLPNKRLPPEMSTQKTGATGFLHLFPLGNSHNVFCTWQTGLKSSLQSDPHCPPPPPVWPPYIETSDTRVAMCSSPVYFIPRARKHPIQASGPLGMSAEHPSIHSANIYQALALYQALDI